MYISKDLYKEKVLGCFMGKNIGGTLGMPMEWDRSQNDITYYTHDLSGEPLPNDDLDIQLLWLIALEQKGFGLDAKVLGEYFNEFMIFTHAEYGTAKTNLRCGLQPPLTGTFNNDFKDSCGSYIRSEIWACLFPGFPELAAKYAFEDAIVDHGDGEGVYAEIMLAAMESAAFYESDIRTLIQIGLSYIPANCQVAQCVKTAIETFDAGINFEDSRALIMKNYVGHLEWHYISPEDEEKGYQEGKMGMDVPSNIMIIIYALLFGKGDFSSSICIAVNYGEDTDCTAGTIAALFGIIYGIGSIDDKWVSPIGHNIVTISLDPFRLSKHIPKTVEEVAERVTAQFEEAICYYDLDSKAEEMLAEKDFFAKPHFTNIYDDVNCVRYESPYLNVRLDYCGTPVLKKDEPKKIRFILSNTSKSITSDRVSVYLYTREGYEVLPDNECSVFLTMAHMGSGIKEAEFEILYTGAYKSIHNFIAEFRFEENKNSQVMTVPFVLVSETGKTLPIKWEKTGPRSTPNLPRL